MSEKTLSFLSELKKWAPLIVTFLVVLEIFFAGIFFGSLDLSTFNAALIVNYFIYSFFFGLAFLATIVLLLIFLAIGLKGEEKALSG